MFAVVHFVGPRLFYNYGLLPDAQNIPISVHSAMLAIKRYLFLGGSDKFSYLCSK